MPDDVPATPVAAESGTTARVPELVGVPAAEAHDRALDAGLLAVPENAWHTAAGRAHIARQDPEPGTAVSTGSIVRIWIGTESGAPA
ncbi:PASTA domain-containing protein [Actinomycetospora straminea]|uniref:PASTA domain-containing protein n=1 Tax=Actinomycetospora straminea TaxID=663607 RepID=UPI00236689A9|nr:PASTA domain-containing protein [Actinomycetospora straminea]MDD7936037.1 PASTA domain-containing protein [Actinomycetospora straminea]